MKKRYILTLLFVFNSASYLFAQAGNANETVIWKGFQKAEFTFEGRSAWLVKPKKPVQGNPWIWRAHYPNWHTEMDSILLERGFHVAYINTNDMFGHPAAMQVWDNFYNYLVADYHLAPKVALEGVSRGGLYVYGWAKRNPDKVSCIYAEAPVCDPKSWPAGKGEGPGSEKDWALWLKLYGLSEAQAADFQDIPLHDLKGLAAFKVPILHVISQRDKIVPASENSDILVQNYLKAGGPISVYPMTRGEQNLEGHHFTIEHPAFFANFIYQNSVPVQQLLPHAPYLETNRGMANAYHKFTTEKKGTVAFLGGSITFNPGWRDKTAQYLREKFPDTKFEFIAAGIPSLGSTPHAFRFSQDVLAYGIPDLLFVEAAINDRGNGFSEKAQVRALEGIMRQMYVKNPMANIVLMAFAETSQNAEFDAGTSPKEIKVHQQIASHYGASFINLAKEVHDRIEAGEFSWKYDFKDLHPSPYGQEVYFQSIKALLQKQPEDQLSAFMMPNLIDKYAYANGKYLDINNAKKLKGFVIDPDWTSKTKLSTRDGFVNVPMLIAESSESSFELEFTGTAIGIAIVSGPDAGIISYSIDGKKAKTMDLFTPWSTQLHLPWYLTLEDELKNKKHKLVLELTADKNEKSMGNAFRMVYFLVNE